MATKTDRERAYWRQRILGEKCTATNGREFPASCSLAKPGDTIYTILRHVSRSGMQRHISVVVIPEGADCSRRFDLTFWTAHALGYPVARNGGIKVTGCGMDMGFQLAYTLSSILYPTGFGCIGDRCPSNDHSSGDRDRTPHTADAPHWHRDGGYALRHAWL